jgi:hypothetical protein
MNRADARRASSAGIAALGLAAWLTACGPVPVRAQAPPAPAGPVKVELRKTGDAWQLYVSGKPFYVKGAGLEFGSPEKLAEHGGNSFRTWRTDNGRESGRQVLDRARKNGLYVTMGLEVVGERHGFNYSDPAAVARQFERVRGEVLNYKDHPALIIWSIGNELNLEARNPGVWDAVNEISKMIHQVDPSHLTTTPLAGWNKSVVQDVRTRASDLDLVSVQMYADIINLPRYLKESAWAGPYLVTEWGATGHWEVGSTEWGAPLEDDSTTKAEWYRKRFEAAIAADRRQCVGSYVFLWGQKQERTPTWYGMFLDTGEETMAVDVLHHAWTGKWPANRSPRLEGAWLDGKTGRQNIRLQPGQACAARVEATDPDQDALSVRWELLEESTDLKTGGDAESRPRPVPDCLREPEKNVTAMKAPAKPGAYRLFVYVFDHRGHAAHANIPFHVDG